MQSPPSFLPRDSGTRRVYITNVVSASLQKVILGYSGHDQHNMYRQAKMVMFA